MIAVDTNLLVYAHRRDSPWHSKASEALSLLAEGPGAWAIAWPCLYEFAAVVTHPSIFEPASTLPQAVEQIDAWMESPTLQLLAEAPDHWEELRTTLSTSRVAGPRVHDARIAALCRHNGVRELWTADRDFNRFPRLKTRNPLIS